MYCNVIMFMSTQTKFVHNKKQRKDNRKISGPVESAEFTMWKGDYGYKELEMSHRQTAMKEAKKITTTCSTSEVISLQGSAIGPRIY